MTRDEYRKWRSSEDFRKLNITQDEVLNYLGGHVQKDIAGGKQCPAGYENYVEFPNYIPKVGKPYVCLDDTYIERGQECLDGTVNHGGFCYSMNCPNGYEADFNSIVGTGRNVTGYCKK